MGTLADLELVTLSGMLRRREVSATEVTHAVLERLEETEPVIRAYSHTCAVEAVEVAQQLDREPWRGPLHGIPFGVKDILAACGAPTRAGSRRRVVSPAVADATVVRRLRAAGAVLIGKHACHEWALGADAPPTRNPWDSARFAGGSSIGSGASVAVGSSVFSVGTDAGGSIRIPAALTGVFGYKPTYGGISAAGTAAGAAVPGLDHIGLITASACDAATVLPAMWGRDPEDARTRWAGEPGSTSVRELRGLRVGVPDLAGLDAEVASRFDFALGSLRAAGMTMIPVELDLSAATAAFSVLAATGVATMHLAALRTRPEEYSDDVRRFLSAALLVPAQHLNAARTGQTRFRQQVRELFDDAGLDLVVSPTVARSTPRLDEYVPVRDVGAMSALTLAWNVTGQPAVSLPCGLSTDGMPVGLQLVGRPETDAALIGIARACERVVGLSAARPWREEPPG
ncbi:amidase [Streptomyces sp. NPDC002346]